MTASIAVGDLLIAEDLSLSAYVLSSWSLPGSTSRQNTVELATGGITFVGDDVGEAGAVSFECHIIGASVDDCADLADDLVATFAAYSDVDECAATVGTRTKVYRGRPLSCVPVLDGSDTGSARCTFTVADPRWYSTTKSVNVTVASMSGGITTPIDTTGGITSTGSGSSGDVTVVNAGTAPAPWTAYINGPVTTPRLILGGQTLELLGDVPAGSTLVVDSYNGTIRLDGASRPWKSFESVWWEIPPGTSTFSFRAVTGTGTATLIWQDASF